MKYFVPTLCLLCLAMCSLARAQDEQQQAPPDEIITDFGIDEYLVVPKFTLSIGARSLSGAKTAFTGHGFVSSFLPGSDITTPNISRIYHDGNVLPDTYPYSFDTTNADGTITSVPGAVSPAGFTNTWTYIADRQLRADGNLDFHAYSADVVDIGQQQKNPKTGMGVELTLARDMGNLTKKLQWKMLLGASLTDIKSRSNGAYDATVTAITDTYLVNLNGQTNVPTAQYSAPSFRPVPRVDADGNPVFDSSGAQIIDYVESTILLGNKPLVRTTTVSTGTVYTALALKGAYFTLRLGPSISYAITERLRATFSAGAALVYAGTEYAVVQTYQPETADPVVSAVTDEAGKFLVGYFFDASLEFGITERAGFYAGAVYQDSGSYTQSAIIDGSTSLTGSHAEYKAQVDLSGLSGFRMGMIYRF